MGKIFCLSGLEYNFAQAHMAPKTEVHEAQPWKSLNLMDRFCTRRGARKRNRKKHFAPRTCNPASCRPILAQLYFPLRRLRLSYSAGQLVQEAVIARAEGSRGSTKKSLCVPAPPASPPHWRSTLVASQSWLPWSKPGTRRKSAEKFWNGIAPSRWRPWALLARRAGHCSNASTFACDRFHFQHHACRH